VYFLIGLALTMLGSFVMFAEPAEETAQLRDTGPVEKGA
jgi:hypothetical protein